MMCLKSWPRAAAKPILGEPVSVLEHGLQAAWYVRREGGEDTLVAAALLHDLGHLLHTEGEDAATRGLDTQHEELAVEALAGHLPPSVLDPIRLHVAAKRHLCSAEPAYLAELSHASVQSLDLQGGPMNIAESGSLFASSSRAGSIASAARRRCRQGAGPRCARPRLLSALD